MNLGTIKTEVEDVIQDKDLSRYLDDFANDIYQDVADFVHFPALKVYSAEGISSVVGSSYASLPSDFVGPLILLAKAGGTDGPINILATLEELYVQWPGLASVGNIKDACFDGGLLYYNPIPVEATTYNVIYFKAPPMLEGDVDEPVLVPSHLHRGIFVEGMAMLAYDRIEDGVDVPKINYNQRRSAYFYSRKRLAEWIERRRKHPSILNQFNI